MDSVLQRSAKIRSLAADLAKNYPEDTTAAKYHSLNMRHIYLSIHHICVLCLCFLIEQFHFQCRPSIQVQVTTAKYMWYSIQGQSKPWRTIWRPWTMNTTVLAIWWPRVNRMTFHHSLLAKHMCWYLFILRFDLNHLDTWISFCIYSSSVQFPTEQFSLNIRNNERSSEWTYYIKLNIKNPEKQNYKSMPFGEFTNDGLSFSVFDWGGPRNRRPKWKIRLSRHSATTTYGRSTCFCILQQF